MAVVIDLNVFERESWDEVREKIVMSDNLFIATYAYDYGSHKNLDILVECDLEQTAAIRRAYPVRQYGDDWFVDFKSAVLPRKVCKEIYRRLADAGVEGV